MRQIINGKLYDTDDAIEFAMHSGGQGKSDFAWFEEALYETAAGSWFLWGRGGPSTRWRKPVGGGCFGYGEGIHPLEPAEALAWMEKAGVDPDVIADRFEIVKA